MILKKKHIYIPIEILVREINPKILFAFKAACKDYRVYIGTKTGIDKLLSQKIKSKLRSGIFFHKSQLLSNSNYINKIKKTCEKFVVLDEELGVGVANINSAFERRAINPKTIDRFFVIGKKMMNLLIKFNPYFKKISKISGWIKYDTYREKNINIYENEIKKIRKNYGKFYLFSSNYGILSNKAIANRLKSRFNKNLKFNEQSIRHFKNSSSDFKYLKKKLSKFLQKNPDFKIIIRPHPSEQYQNDWTFFEKFKNVSLVMKYDIVPWIISSQGIIHRGCTSAVDAFILNKPIYYLCPNRILKPHEKNLTYEISEKIKDFNSIKKKNLKKKFFNRKILLNEISLQRPSYSKIINELNNFKIKKEIKIRLNNFSNFMNYLIPKIGNLKILINKFFFNKKNISYSKIPEFINKDELIKKIDLINSKNIKIKIFEVTREVFEIEKK